MDIENHNLTHVEITNPPWDARLFLPMALLFTFGGAGLLAGLNWRRLGKPERTRRTILACLVGEAVAALGLTFFFPLTTALLIGVALNLGAGWWLARQQRADFSSWKQANLEASEKTNLFAGDWRTPLIAALVGLLVAALAGVAGNWAQRESIRAAAQPYLDLAEVYLAQGDPEQAIESYTQALQINPQEAPIYFKRGNAYLELGDPARASWDFATAYTLDPNFYAAFFNHGMVNLASGRPELALPDFTEAIRIEPEDGMAYYYRGLCYAHLNLGAQAIADLEDALSLGLDPPLAENATNLLDQIEP